MTRPERTRILLTEDDIPEMERLVEGRMMDDVVGFKGQQWLVTYMRHVIMYLRMRFELPTPSEEDARGDA